MRDILIAYRAWLGFPKAREIVVPLPLMRLLLRLGDLAGLFGYPTSLRTTSLAQMGHDRLVDGTAFAKACTAPLKSFHDTLTASPATLQDRLHARSFFVLPLLQVTLALYWIATGAVTLTPRSFAGATSLVEAGGFSPSLAWGALVGGSAIADIVAGALFLLPRFVRRAGVAQLLLSAFYLLGLSLIAPGLWSEHFGPLLKSRCPADGRHRRGHGGPGTSLRGALSLYFALKFLHLVGAALLLGTGIGTAFFLLMADRTGEPRIVAATLRIVVIADAVFTAASAFAQPITGLLLARLAGYALTETWLLLSIPLYLVVGACWLPVVALQIRMRDIAIGAAKAGGRELPPAYWRLRRAWLWLGWPAFLSLLAIFWLMLAKPV